MKKALSLALAAAMTAGLLAGCGSKPAPAPAPEPAPAATEAAAEETEAEDAGEEDASDIQAGGTLVVRSIGDPMSFNPDLYPDDNYYPISQNLFHRLCKMDASKTVIPDLATDWEWSDDALTLTFHLQEGVKWSDGEDVTSEDVKYTFDTMKDVETSCYFSSTVQTYVDNIETPDDYTVVFNLKEANVSFVPLLGWYGTFIVPEHVFNNGQSWAENEATTTAPVTSGNFKFNEFKAGEYTSIVKSEYAAVEPYLDEVVFSIVADESTAVQAFKNGEIDFYEAIPTAYQDELLADPSVEMKTNEYPSPMRIIFNFNNETLADQAVRTAISLCINRDEISTKLYNGLLEPEYSMYPSLLEWCANTEDVPGSYDIEAAKAVLEEAGYEADADGYYVKGLTITAFEGSGYPDAAKLISAAAAEAGIEIIVEVLEYNAWSDKVYTNKAFDIELQGGFMGPDPSALVAKVGTGGSDNIGSYSNEEIDALLIAGGTTGDQAARAEAYKAAQAILAEELPMVPILTYACYDANGANVKNVPLDGIGQWGWAEWTYTYFAD